MQERLNELLENSELVEKILFYYKKWGKISASFLMNKFKINSFLANQIMEIIKTPELDKKP